VDARTVTTFTRSLEIIGKGIIPHQKQPKNKH